MDTAAGENSATQAAVATAVGGDVASTGTSAATGVQPAALSVKQDLSRIRQTVADFCEDAGTAEANNESVNVDTESDYEKSDDFDDEADESTTQEHENSSVRDVSERIPVADDVESGDLPLNSSASKRKNSKLRGSGKRKSVDETAEDGENKRVRFAQSETIEIESSDEERKH